MEPPHKCFGFSLFGPSLPNGRYQFPTKWAIHASSIKVIEANFLPSGCHSILNLIEKM